MKKRPLLSFKRLSFAGFSTFLKKKEVAELHRASPSATLDKRFIIFFCKSDRTNINYRI